MLTNFIYLLAFSFFGIGLLSLFCRDFMWEIELRMRKLQGLPKEKLERDTRFEKTFDFVGIYVIVCGIILLVLAISR